MIHDSTPHRIFKISELTRLIASQLILVNPGSTVNLACACRCLEEPALSTLWEIQQSLCTLLEVLPKDTLGWEKPAFNTDVLRIVADPPPEAWERVQRYASWMRGVRVVERTTIGEDTFDKLRLNSPTHGWFPALQNLCWIITRSNLPHASSFFSPHLKKVSIYMSRSWSSFNIPHDLLPAIASTISMIPASNLQLLHVGVDPCRVSWPYFKDSVSSVVLRCESSLTDLNSPIPLSDAAINHLIHLPHLTAWCTEGPPPSYPDLPSPLVLPPLTDLSLDDSAACKWLPLFRRLERSVPTVQTVTPLSKMKKSLRSLSVEDTSGSIIDVTFTSTIQMFSNLVTLQAEMYCHDDGEEGECTFKLNNDDVAKFAMSLPQIEYLLLGYPCAKNTCATTVACLVPISAYCVKLRDLGIHFNTTNILDDLESVSKDPKFQALRSLPRRALTRLNVYYTPLALDGLDLETAVKGMVDIFPSLERCGSAPRADRVWGTISGIIDKLRGNERSRRAFLERG